MSINLREAEKPILAITNGAICAGGIPKVVSVSENSACLVETTTSPQLIKPIPPATAAPSTKVTTTCGIVFKTLSNSPISTLAFSISLRSVFGFWKTDLKPFKSPPAQKMLSLPRNVIPRIPPSFFVIFKTLSNSFTISVDNAFLKVGRFNQISNQPSAFSTKIVEYIFSSLHTRLV